MNEDILLSEVLKSDFELFTRYFFTQINGYKFIINHHHKIMFSTIQKVIKGEIKRLVINIPPGYSKSLIAVHYFIAFGLTVNPQSRFLQSSYSDGLVLGNSQAIRDIITHESYKKLYPLLQLEKHSNAKGKWDTIQGGYVYSASSGGAITGWRAGRMQKGIFTGALILDDPLKISDAFSDVKRNFINARYNNTFKSRLAHEDIPVVVIMQRVHEEDFTNMLLTGGSGERWWHLNLPIEYRKPKEYSHAINIPYNWGGVLWDYKHRKEDVEILKNSDTFTYNSQYMQDPESLEEGIYKRDYFDIIQETPIEYEALYIFADTAMKVGEHNDYSVFQLWGKFDNNIYLIEQHRGKWTAPDLLIQAQMIIDYARGLENIKTKLKGLYIEDKASGIGLIQQISKNDKKELKETKEGIRIYPLNPIGNKLQRAMSSIPYMEQGKVKVFEKSWLSEYIVEFLKFKADGTHAHDDQVDTTNYAIIELLSKNINKKLIW